MAKAEAQKRDAYYRKKYGVGLDWYEARYAEQGGKCGICRRPQSVFKNRFAVDHDHSYKLVKIETVRQTLGKWAGKCVYLGEQWVEQLATKSQVIRSLRAALKRRSCRGLLCPFCNRGLRYYQDDPTRLANASEYLRKHQC